MSELKSSHSIEITQRKRFEFGANWARFLTKLNDQRIEQAVQSLRDMLGVESLQGKRFLDVGSGSGLFSLAARKLGASVHSFDYDPTSVACTKELKRRYFADDENWIIEEGSVLDQKYLKKIGQFHVVYSWGVIHHTGDMWQGLHNISLIASERIFIAIYNDQGLFSKYWTAIKRIYNFSWIGKLIMISLHMSYLFLMRLIVRAITNRPLERGMSLWYDMLDWLGGFPFEVARPEQIIEFYVKKNFRCVKLKTCGSKMGCNEFVFLDYSSKI